MGAKVADIVAVQNKLLWAIETKLSFGLSVIEQSSEWCGQAHYSSVAVPQTKGSRFAQIVAQRFGVGVLVVQPGDVWERSAPQLNRKVGEWLKNSLNETQKTYAKAGNSCGSRWTPFQETCRSIRAVVSTRPGISMKDLLATIRTHYRTTATARSCIAKWAEAGAVKGVVLKRDGRELRLYPEELK
jgi:hypothetical protein